jgi:D-alanyl-D-alanine carboxypeptidase
MKKTILVVLMVALIATPCLAQETSTLATELQEALDEVREELGIIGISAAVTTPDEGLWLGVSGLSDKKAQTPIQPEMLFCIGSITKNFIATLVLQLAEEGLLDLDDTVGDWLPDLPEKSSRWIDDTVTIRQLLNHTSGVNDFVWRPPNLIAIASVLLAPYKIWEPEDTLRFVRRPYASPGEGFYYSNTNYILLGMIIEKTTNSNIAVELRNRFFDPLGLENTFVGIEEPINGELAHGHLGSIDFSGFPRESHISFIWSAAAIYSTAEDIALWTQALFGGNVLNEDSLQQMIDFSELSKDSVSPGLGLFKYEHPRFGDIWVNDGLWLGYLAIRVYLPQDEIVVVVLLNQMSGDLEVLTDSLIEVALN